MILKAPISDFSGAVNLPASKSISNRVLVINALAGNNQLPYNLSDCDDTNAVLDWMQIQPDIIDVGAAGTAMRFSTALLAMTEGTHTITGSQRMKQRPIAILVDALRTLGANIKYLENEGFPPLRIEGNNNMVGGTLELDGSVSSQFITALLIIAPYMQNGLKLRLKNKVISRSYINMSLKIMNDFGADANWISDSEIEVKHGRYVKRDFWIENDWSAASYWYEIMALSDSCNTIMLKGLKPDSIQGDSCVAQMFRKLGVNTTFNMDGKIPVAMIEKSGKPSNNFEEDLSNCPDLAQTMAVTCCMMDIPFRFHGLSTLKIKETDRIQALVNELGKLGFLLKESDNYALEWNGEKRLLDPEESNKVAIDTYNDHRMAMAFAPVTIKTKSLIINDPGVVSKSYPNFWNDLKEVGFLIE